MVPSRSRNTAGRRSRASDISGAPDRQVFGETLHSHSSFEDRIDADPRHAAMIDGATAKETRTAGDGLADEGKLIGQRSGTFGVRRAENSDHRQAHRGGYMHCSGVVSNEK